MAEDNKKEDIDDKEYEGVALDFTEFQNAAWQEAKSIVGVKQNHKYSRSQIEKFLDSPQRFESQIRDVSLYFATTYSNYSRLVFYMSNMLTLDHLVVPYNINKESVKDDRFVKEFNEATDYIDNYNIKHEISKVLDVMFLEDTYFGYERISSNGTTLQKLPARYCRIAGIRNGLYTFEFNMEYFGAGSGKLANFPKDFAVLYRRYKKTGKPWQMLDPDYAVCFKVREDITYSVPYFSGMFIDVLDNVESKELSKAKDKLENFKLLLQKIPFKKDPKSERDMIISGKSVRNFHENIKTVLPEQVGLISTPMDIEEYSFEKSNNTLRDSLNDSRKSVFDSAGVSSGLFNSGDKSSVALGRSIETDEAVLFRILRQFERFFNSRLRRDNVGKYTFKVAFPDLTIYNRSEMMDRYLKSAQFGFPKSLVATSIGLSTRELTGLSVLENEYLELDDLLRPLSSTHTQGADKAGAPKKSDSEISESGVESRDNEDEDKRIEQ